jgi:hypothetical protein
MTFVGDALTGASTNDLHQKACIKIEKKIVHIIIYVHAKVEIQQILVQCTTKKRKSVLLIVGCNCSVQTQTRYCLNIDFSFLKCHAQVSIVSQFFMYVL